MGIFEETIICFALDGPNCRLPGRLIKYNKGVKGALERLDCWKCTIAQLDWVSFAGAQSARSRPDSLIWVYEP
jgi:hypothetical protein